ncbi:CoA-acylating methylmalonate-semialdehyde dehydrogenase [Pyrobaculum ferrireducens]|uniref:methylmalonate-semialdehyde dehydrogenase (CoA acylating) n=1 Tax=Pyrobaculum ferrireducens TaxID=1104324 RepID=G7VHL2_9CREN|nr:CoA-acylating methylmalonate-semialdehyde dehydrogenase [Pyrobaculum ferrireducens]AET33303.1 Methylmalonate-semialdehyde dehydrogenase (acylating) [Pyrobaculum ferrireducens]
MIKISSSYGLLKPLVEGKFVDVDHDRVLPTYDPGLGRQIGEVPVMKNVDEAVQSAARAFEKWSRLPVYERLQYLVKLKIVFEQRLEEMAHLIAQNVGKTKQEAMGELRRAVESIDMALAAPHLMAEVRKVMNIAQAEPEIDMETVKEPLGVFAVITPFNFPVMIPMWFIPLAVTLGDTVVLKPSEQDPVPALYMASLFVEAGYPPGVLNVVLGDGSTAETLIKHRDVVGVAFVGSTRVGSQVYALAAAHGKRALVGAGAKNPVVVMPDADMKNAVENIATGFFVMAGQRCLAPGNLILVGEAYDKFKNAIVERVKKIRVGYQLLDTTDMGPVISAASKKRISDMITRAAEAGAEVLVDGRSYSPPREYAEGFYLGPTVLDKVAIDMEIAQEEVFGPVLPIIRAESFEEAVEIANKTRYGNAASIFTSSGRYAREFARRVNAGNVGINMSIAQPTPHFPFGGRKQSFFGVLHAQVDAVDFFTDRKVIMQRWW